MWAALKGHMKVCVKLAELGAALNLAGMVAGPGTFCPLVAPVCCLLLPLVLLSRLLRLALSLVLMFLSLIPAMSNFFSFMLFLLGASTTLCRAFIFSPMASLVVKLIWLLLLSNQGGYTALMLAGEKGHMELCIKLVELGADPTLVDDVSE